MKKNSSNRSEYNHFILLGTRWNDNDIYGHMNNVIYYELFDTAVNKWLLTNNLLDIQNGKNIGLIVKSGCDFFSSFAYPEDIEAGIRVTKIGTSSVRYEVGLFRKNQQLSRGQKAKYSTVEEHVGELRRRSMEPQPGQKNTKKHPRCHK